MKITGITVFGKSDLPFEKTRINIEGDETIDAILKELFPIDGEIQLDIILSREDIDESKLKQAIDSYLKNFGFNIDK